MLTAELGRRWPVGALARVCQPGCKLDIKLVVVGAQGIGNSTTCAALVQWKSWFSDTPFDLGNKDAYLHFQGVWLYEAAELQARPQGSRRFCPADATATGDATGTGSRTTLARWSSSGLPTTRSSSTTAPD